MADIAYVAPSSIDEVFDALDTYGEDARLMAGGTGLVNMMKQRLVQPGCLINLSNLAGYDKYIVFAWPTAWGIPTYTNGINVVTAYTRIYGTYSFVNQFGYTASYDIWITNTPIGGSSTNPIYIT